MDIRMTSARQAILDQLSESQSHLSATQIHDALKERLPSLNLSTVYRSLDYLVGKKLVSVADIGQGSPVYELVGESTHHHIVCLNCHYTLQIEEDVVAPFFQQLKEDYGFEIITNHLVLYGSCPGCQA